MQALSDRLRKRLVYAAAICCTVPVFLAPLAGRTSYQIAPTTIYRQRNDSSTVPRAWPARALLRIIRDPFAGEPDASAPVKPSLGGNTGCSSPVLRAVAMGVLAQALLACSSGVRLVEAGDWVGTVRVARIMHDAIFFTNGTRLRLKETME